MRRVPPVCLLLILLVGIAPLAGCLGPAQATAQEAQRATDPRVHELDPDAQLVFAAGLEGRVQSETLRDMLGDSWFDGLGFETIDENGTGVSYWDRIEQDGDVGDGKSELWILHYLSGDKEREYVHLVDRDGKTLHQEERESSGYTQGVGDYAWDSDRAMRAAKQANPDLRDTLESSNLIVGTGLLMDGDHGGPVWTISAMGGDLQGFRGAFVQVDARNGEVIGSDSESFGP